MTPHRRLNFFFCIALLVANFAFTGAVAAQQPASIRSTSTLSTERLIAIGATIDTRTPLYTRVAPETALVFAGEPLRLRVRVANNTDTTVALESASGPWTEQLRVTVQRRTAAGLESPRGAIVTSRLTGTAAQAMRPRESASSELELENRPEDRLTAGAYLVKVSLNPTVLDASVQRLHNILDRELSVEVREPTTLEEKLDRYLNRSYRAFATGRLAEARSWAGAALLEHASSLPALIDIGATWYREGNCAEATPALQRALQVAKTRSDPFLLRYYSDDETHLQAMLAACSSKR